MIVESKKDTGFFEFEVHLEEEYEVLFSKFSRSTIMNIFIIVAVFNVGGLIILGLVFGIRLIKNKIQQSK